MGTNSAAVMPANKIATFVISAIIAAAKYTAQQAGKMYASNAFTLRQAWRFYNVNRVRKPIISLGGSRRGWHAAEFVANKPLLYAYCADLYKQDLISCKKNIFTV